MKTDYMMTAADVAEALGISKSHAYKLIRDMNDELLENGYMCVAGRIPRPFWESKFYGLGQEVRT